MTYAIPTQAFVIQMNYNDVAFMYRLEKLVAKLIKLEASSNTDKMYDLIIDIKTEIETSCGISCNLGQNMDEVERLIINLGIKPPKKQFESIRKSLKKKEKKNRHHAEYIALNLYRDNYQFNEYDEQMLFKAKHGKGEEEEKGRNQCSCSTSFWSYIVSLRSFSYGYSICGM